MIAQEEDQLSNSYIDFIFWHFCLKKDINKWIVGIIKQFEQF